MMRSLLFFFIAIFFFSSYLSAQNNSQSVLMKNYDVKHYNLDLQISSLSAKISGNVIITASVVAPKLDTIAVELIDTLTVNYTYMVVDSVKMNQTLQRFTHKNDLIIVPLVNPLNQGQLFSIQIYYHGIATPSNKTNGNGILFVKSKKESFSMSESRSSKLWWPCKQDLSDKADSVTFSITTESVNKSGSNGLLKSTENLPNGKVKYTWETHYPIDYYLISFVVGPFEENVTYAKLKSSNDSVKIQSLLLHDSPNYQKNLAAIEVTKNLIGVFSELFGDYPFKNEKYGYCAVDSMPGAMENQTMTTINSYMFEPDPNPSNSNTWVIAHELAHNWFGDYVTCKTWNDIWINEGFASYMEYLALQKMKSNTSAKAWMTSTHSFALQNETESIYVPDSVLNDRRMFKVETTYKKGASILHMLRYEINNDSLFFKGLNDFLAQFKNSVAGAVDFKNTMEHTTGMDFTDFFNQWYYGVGYPNFLISWSQSNDTLTFVSTQKTSSLKQTYFKLHFDVKVKYLSGDFTVRLYQNINNQTFKIPISGNVLSVEIDPDDWILKLVRSVVTDTKEYVDNLKTVLVYPNPSSVSANIEFYLNKPQPVRIEILNLNGAIEETKLIHGLVGVNKALMGASLHKATYVYRIIFNDKIESGKLIKL